MLIGLARALREQECRPIVGAFQDRRFPNAGIVEEAQRHSLEIELVPCAGRMDWKAVRRIRRLVQERRVDVIHAHGYKADCYAFAAALRGRAALFATSHNWPNRHPLMQAYARADRMVLRRFDGVGVVSEVVSSLLRRSGVPAERIAVVHNGVDVGAFRAARQRLRSERGWTQERLIGFVGRLVPDKGGDILLRAAQSVVAAYPDTRVVFVGGGPAREAWEALAAQLGIGSSVHFTGVRNDMPEVYASLDMVVLPSLIEAMPMCLIEAMAAGKPVIATRVGAVPKVVAPGVTGLLTHPGDVMALRWAILRLIEEPDLAHRLGANGAAQAAQHFSDTTMAQRYLALYERAIAHSQRRRQPPVWRQWVRAIWTTRQSESQSL
jgi:glycosyltransferase involved in cell wall biosynthesis